MVPVLRHSARTEAWSSVLQGSFSPAVPEAAMSTRSCNEASPTLHWSLTSEPQAVMRRVVLQ